MYFMIIVLSEQIISKEYNNMRLAAISLLPLVLFGISIICYISIIGNPEDNIFDSNSRVSNGSQEDDIEENNKIYIVVSNFNDSIAIGSRVEQ